MAKFESRPPAAPAAFEKKSYRQEAERFLERFKDLFHALVQDRSLTFKIGKGFQINYEKREITLALKDFKDQAKRGESEAQIIWSTCHELAHYLDLQEDPEGMLANFRYIEKRARELAPQVMESLAKRAEKTGVPVPARFSEQIKVDKDGRTMSGAEIFVFKTLHRQVYNALDDIYVNRRLGQRVAMFSSRGSKQEEVSRLYRDFLFPTSPLKIGKPPAPEEAVDFAALPKSYQLADALLRQYMVPDQAVLVAPEVKEIHESFSDAMARKLGFDFSREVLERITNPGNPATKKASWRYQQIRRLVEPEFVKLFLHDLETMPPPKPPEEPEDEPEEGDEGESGDEADFDMNPWATPNPGPGQGLGPEDVKRYIAGKKKAGEKEAAEKKAKAKSPEDRAHDAQEQSDDDLCKKMNVPPEAAKEYRRYQAEVKPYLKQLSQVFEAFMQSIEPAAKKEWYSGFKRGRLNVDQLVRKYGPELVSGKASIIPWEKLDVYDQQDFIRRFVLYPTRIRVRLVLDGSGSMIPDRIDALKRLSVFFLEALGAFQESVNLQYRLTEPFVVDTEIRMFGSADKTEVVKGFAHEKTSLQNEMAERFGAFSKINNDWGSTFDAVPLAKINNAVDSKYAQELEKGRAMEMLFEITDGGSNTAQASKFLVDKLTAKGVITRGLQIGTPDEEEQIIFNNIWGKNGTHVQDVGSLAAKVASMLAEEIDKIKLKVKIAEAEKEEDE